jgi:hypothetical protein
MMLSSFSLLLAGPVPAGAEYTGFANQCHGNNADDRARLNAALKRG